MEDDLEPACQPACLPACLPGRSGGRGGACSRPGGWWNAQAGRPPKLPARPHRPPRIQPSPAQLCLQCCLQPLDPPLHPLLPPPPSPSAFCPLKHPPTHPPTHLPTAQPSWADEELSCWGDLADPYPAKQAQQQQQLWIVQQVRFVRFVAVGVVGGVGGRGRCRPSPLAEHACACAVLAAPPRSCRPRAARRAAAPPAAPGRTVAAPSPCRPCTARVPPQYCEHGTLGDAIDRGWLRHSRSPSAPPNMRVLLATAQVGCCLPTPFLPCEPAPSLCVPPAREGRRCRYSGDEDAALSPPLHHPSRSYASSLGGGSRRGSRRPASTEPPRPPAPAARLPPPQEIAGALAYLHSEGVLHGDLTPANVLLAAAAGGAAPAKGRGARKDERGFTALVRALFFLFSLRECAWCWVGVWGRGRAGVCVCVVCVSCVFRVGGVGGGGRGAAASADAGINLWVASGGRRPELGGLN
jgi:hypothetical protein